MEPTEIPNEENFIILDKKFFFYNGGLLSPGKYKIGDKTIVIFDDKVYSLNNEIVNLMYMINKKIDVGYQFVRTIISHYVPIISKMLGLSNQEFNSLNSINKVENFDLNLATLIFR